MKSHAIIVPLLFLGMSAADHYTDWHTTPDRWVRPRTYHTPFNEQYTERISIDRVSVAAATIEKTFSPNNAYWYACSTSVPDSTLQGSRNSELLIYNERDYLSRILLIDHSQYGVEILWINEKLINIRVWWGRVLGTDMIFDAESESLIFKEMLHDGTNAYQQWQQGMKGSEPKSISGEELLENE